MEPILLNIEGSIATIILNRPQVFNSFNLEMGKQMHKALDDCKMNNDIRVIVIIGEGKAFCAGQDISEITSDNPPSFDTILDEHYNPIIQRIRAINKPVICAVNGVAAGAGANIALACDLVIATESASFIQAFAKIGLIPDSGGTFFLPRLIGLPRAVAMMMTGEKVSASDAQNIGMIYKCVPDDLFKTEVDKLAIQIANMPTKALGLIKELVNKSFANTLDEQLKLETKYQGEAANSHDYNEGVLAFVEKRKPIFNGN
jgi:2-(1,2-epoxy-1,2-dihydrophenyl)acetyl-CoA isomerase